MQKWNFCRLHCHTGLRMRRLRKPLRPRDVNRINYMVRSGVCSRSESIAGYQDLGYRRTETTRQQRVGRSESCRYIERAVGEWCQRLYACVRA